MMVIYFQRRADAVNGAQWNSSVTTVATLTDWVQMEFNITLCVEILHWKRYLPYFMRVKQAQKSRSDK